MDNRFIVWAHTDKIVSALGPISSPKPDDKFRLNVFAWSARKDTGANLVRVPIGSTQPLDEKVTAHYKTGYKCGTVAQGHKVHFNKTN
jgi:hypothetical protein